MDLTKAQKMVEQNFQKMMERNLDFWPRFGLMAQLAQNGPKLEN